MRCSTSGRLTPAAATLIRTSPDCGCGTGRSAGCRTSGPPGCAIATAFILAGGMRWISAGKRRILRHQGEPMPQFRVEFVMDPATGKYLAELYNPENAAELLARTEALYANQTAAAVGMVELVKSALGGFRLPSRDPRSRPKARSRPAPR